jgi:hypothetical protein
MFLLRLTFPFSLNIGDEETINIPKGGRHMRNSRVIFLLLGLSLLLSLGTASAGQFGAPEPISNDGNFSLGVGYFYYSNEYKNRTTNDTFKLKQNMIYAQFTASYRQVEFYGRVGGADMRIDDKAFTTSAPGYSGFKSDFSDDTFEPFVTVGAKGAWEFAPHFSLGPNLQASYFIKNSDQTTGTVSGAPATQKLEIGDSYQVDLGVFLQAKFKPVTFYAGPFIYLVRGDFTKENTISGITTKTRDKFEENSNFGGAGGIRINIYRGLSVELEARYSEEFSAGGLISYSF